MNDKKYQSTILNEWHNANDDEYARYLFDLVADQSSGKYGKVAFFLLCVLCGLFVGLAITFFGLFTFRLSEYGNGIIVIGSIITGAIIGLIGSARQKFSLEHFLQLLTPKKSFHIYLKFFGTFDNIFVLSAGILLISWSLGVAIGSVSFGVLLALYNLLNGSDPTWFSGNFAIFLFLGAVGLGFFIGNHHFDKAGWFVGSFSSLGFLLGDITAFIFFSIVLMRAGYLLEDFQLSKIMFVIGFSVAGLRSVKSAKPMVTGTKAEGQFIHTYRAWWVWWKKKPTSSELQIALQETIIGNTSEIAATWVQLLKELQKKIQQNLPSQDCIINLHHQDWQERFIARQIIKERAEETIVLANSVAHLICSDCFVRYYSHKIQLSNHYYITFYGCRECYEHTRFIDWPNSVVAILDTKMSERFVKVNSSLLVNWLAHRSIFDFDWIEIKQAKDEDVERLAIQFSNDSDDMRKSKHTTMRCIVDKGCKLSENSARILQRVFNQVVYT